jgi:hypothetical protein
MTPSKILPGCRRRALRAGVADRIQHFPDLGSRRIRREARRRVMTGGFDSALPGVRIRAVPHPSVLLALQDGADLLQQGDRLSTVGPDRGASFCRLQHRFAPDWRTHGPFVPGCYHRTGIRIAGAAPFPCAPRPERNALALVILSSSDDATACRERSPWPPVPEF